MIPRRKWFYVAECSLWNYITHHCFLLLHRRQGTCVLVHCKMGVSRSASTVIAYAMKEYEWTLEQALKHVKERRSIVQPNAGFMRQLQTYQGILGARWEALRRISSCQAYKILTGRSSPIDVGTSELHLLRAFTLHTVHKKAWESRLQHCFAGKEIGVYSGLQTYLPPSWHCSLICCITT